MIVVNNQLKKHGLPQPMDCPLCEAPVLAIVRDGTDSLLVCTRPACRCKVERYAFGKQTAIDTMRGCLRAWNNRSEP